MCSVVINHGFVPYKIVKKHKIVEKMWRLYFEKNSWLVSAVFTSSRLVVSLRGISQLGSALIFL